MKNRLVLLFAAIVTALGCVACSMNDVSESQSVIDPVAMACFTADIRTAAATRANAEGTAFAQGDKVGIVPLKSGEVDTPQYNTLYTFNGTQFEANPPYWFRDRSSVTFNAYYPYTTGIAADGTIDIDTKAENQKATDDGWRLNDILFAAASTDVSTPTVSYSDDNAFTHQLSKLTLTFKAGKGIDNLSSLQSYTIGSLVTEGGFNAIKGDLSLKAGAVAGDLTMAVTGAAEPSIIATSLILLPQSLTDGALNLSVKFNDQIYKASLSLADGLKAGTHHTFNVTINSTGLVLGTPQIVDWEPAAGGDTDATMPDELD